MKETGALIGGEGNGGVIYPELHYGRDALVGIALFLTLLAKSGKKVSELRATYPNYAMSKQRVDLPSDVDAGALLERLAKEYSDKGDINLIDGVKIDLPTEWVHVRRSNTEPIIRIYTEAPTAERPSVSQTNSRPSSSLTSTKQYTKPHYAGKLHCDSPYRELGVCTYHITHGLHDNWHVRRKTSLF